MNDSGQFFETIFHWSNLLIIPGLLIAFTVHELGHNITAYFLGDTSQAKLGRITVNPLKHISWLGGFLFLLFGIGWPKPLRFDSRNFKDLYLDSFLVAVIGPAANMAVFVVLVSATAMLLGIMGVFNVISEQQITDILFFSRNSDLASLTFPEAMQSSSVWIVAFTNRVWVANFILAVVSIIPLPLFDGFTAVFSLLGMYKEWRVKQIVQSSAIDIPADVQTGEIIQPQPVTSQQKESVTDIHFKLGADYHQQQQFDDAIARYRLALNSDNSFGPAYVNMGLAYLAKDQRKEAIHALRGATQFASDEKSRNQAWAELQKLSEFPVASEESAIGEAPPPAPVGSIPWTDTAPSPNWAIFWMGLIGLGLLVGCPLGLLLSSLLF